MVIARRREKRPHAGISKERFAIWLLVIGETMFFAALVGVYIVLRFSALREGPTPGGELVARSWAPADFAERAWGLPLSNLLVLVLSGIFFAVGSRALSREDPGGFRLHVSLALVAGLTFVAMQVVEMRGLLTTTLPLGGRSIFSTVFHSLVGLHALHVGIGVVLLGYVLVQGFRGRYHRYRRVAVDLCAAYWYLVVLVWIVFYVLLYFG